MAGLFPSIVLDRHANLARPRLDLLLDRREMRQVPVGSGRAGEEAIGQVRSRSEYDTSPCAYAWLI